MNTLREAAQQALEALEYGGLLKKRQAITALRAALVAVTEREQCAKVCESLFDADDDSCNEAEQCAQAIRARGKG